MTEERHFVEPCAVDAAIDYLSEGFALVEIVPGSKGPRTPGWNLRENVWESDNVGIFTSGPLIDAFGDDRRGMGLAHAFSGTMALDVDDWDRASVWLADRGVDLRALFDAPDAVQLLSGRAGRAKLIYRLPRGPIVTKQPAGSGLELRCMDSKGGTHQDVLPPSIHPDTGKPYYWAGAGNWRDLPLIPPQLLQAWLNLTVKPKEAAQLAESGVHDGSTGVYSEAAVWDVINKIDPDSEYPLWIKVGMAIHEETSGEEPGYAIFDQWSSKGTKYAGPEQTRAKWDSFQGSDRPVTLAGLIDRFEPASVDAFEDLGPLPEKSEAVEPTAAGKIRFTLESAEAVDQDDAPLDYFIKGVLPKGELGVLYGASGSGKSFIMLDMALAIAAGIQWRGHRVQQARVVYVVNEGKRSFRKRTRAYKLHHALPTLPDALRIVRDRTPGFLSAEDPRHLAADILAQGGADLIVIDTLSQSIAGGDENSSEVMSRVARLAGQLAARTGAMVLFVHHSGKDEARGQRGHSSLRAACDVELAVARDKYEMRTLTITKSKDDADGREYGFKLKVVTIGTDQDGDAVTSCVCEEAEAPLKAAESSLSPIQNVLMRGFEAMCPPGDDSVSVEELVESVKGQVANEGSRDLRRQKLMQAVMALQNKGVVKLMDGQLVRVGL